jgi:signal transduction protein with GAF and PtsI domain
MLLAKTDEDVRFRQYVKTSRTGSSAYAPMVRQGRFIGQIVMATRARWTYREEDLAALVVASRNAAAVWIAQGGPAWLAARAEAPDAWRVTVGGA